MQTIWADGVRTPSDLFSFSRSFFFLFFLNEILFLLIIIVGSTKETLIYVYIFLLM